ncbi:cell division protein FtsK [Kitasatospora sp. NA04385]|uniref:FtsK/SpoIIIE domain-containing protein n=1 Tax=Kitasatospora sp. NA04385 TaxID=2742135 RepID=UPI0015925CF3|nr:FtsK/SpoIIIE domain-containing protein [Kitasatospora sp. NA04385]QKW21111.1 cell division protein FtsK [Kitasatospora sp. NA04385]
MSNTPSPTLGADFLPALIRAFPAPLLYGLAILLLVMFARLLFVTGRYIASDRDTRASRRQAFWIRRRWARLSKALGLVTVDRHPTLGQAVVIDGQRRREPAIHVPRIATKCDRYGVRITVSTTPGVGLAEFQRHAEHLAEAWNCTRVSVAVDRPGYLVLRAVRTEPLAATSTAVPDGSVPADLSVWDLGRDEYAVPAVLRIAEVPGMLVGGLPGKGKSSLMNGLLSQLAPSGAVQFAVADGKVHTVEEGDYADVAERLFAFVGADLEEANALFKRLVRLRLDRSKKIREDLGVTNMWHVGPTPKWPLVVLVVDEAHTFFRDFRGSDPETKRLAALAHENARLVEELVKMGRATGFLVILITQKPTGDAIPTAIRDVCPIALSFAQRSTEAAVATLGENIRQWKDMDPSTMQHPDFVGVAVMAREGHEGFIRVRTPYVAPTDVARIAKATAHLTTDPAHLLAA